MKKALFLAILIGFAACEGPEGPTGPSGTAGNNGTNGTNGTNGSNSLVALADDDSQCEGGVKITAGLDVNNDGVLQDSEVKATKYVCGGQAGPKEVRLGQFEIGSKTSDDDYTVTTYSDLDISQYPGYNVATFVLKDVVVEDGGGTPSAIEYTVEAYDATNDGAIAGSQVTVNSGNYTSPNFLDNIPTGKFDLAIHAHKNTAGAVKISATGYVVLYKVD